MYILIAMLTEELEMMEQRLEANIEAMTRPEGAAEHLPGGEEATFADQDSVKEEVPSPPRLSPLATPSPNSTMSDRAPEEPENVIPDIRAGVPKPQLGAPTLSPEAIRSRAKRIFTPRANGQLKVSAEIYQEWHKKGSKERRNLELIFKQCGYSPDRGC